MQYVYIVTEHTLNLLLCLLLIRLVSLWFFYDTAVTRATAVEANPKGSFKLLI